MLTKGQILESILEGYNYCLPYVVAEYTCLLFQQQILCKTKITHKNILKPLFKLRKQTFFLFQKEVNSSNKDYNFFRLTGFKVLDPVNKIDNLDFQNEISTIIAENYYGAEIEWGDDDKKVIILY
jgi:hypothetical protein